jgi:hypothetical protein
MLLNHTDHIEQLRKYITARRFAEERELLQNGEDRGLSLRESSLA